MSKYSALDGAIMSAIKGGHMEFKVIANLPYVSKEANYLVTNVSAKPGWRFVDARLQALRKDGQIKFQRKSKTHAEGWIFVDAVKS